MVLPARQGLQYLADDPDGLRISSTLTQARAWTSPVISTGTFTLMRSYGGNGMMDAAVEVQAARPRHDPHHAEVPCLFRREHPGIPDPVLERGVLIVNDHKPLELPCQASPVPRECHPRLLSSIST